MRDDQVKRPGFQRLRANQYDDLRRQLAGKGANIKAGQVIGGDVLCGFGEKKKKGEPGSPSQEHVRSPSAR
eukprot:273064-Chlamydomonas_euryale.AAC.1